MPAAPDQCGGCFVHHMGGQRISSGRRSQDFVNRNCVRSDIRNRLIADVLAHMRHNLFIRIRQLQATAEPTLACSTIQRGK
jgi:hypothetical protein